MHRHLSPKENCLPQINRNNLRLPVYRDGEDMEAFLISFETVAELRGLPKDCYATHLAGVLSEKFLVYYSQLPPAVSENYEMLRSALIQGYDNYHSPHFYRRLFYESKPQAGLSFEEYAMSLENKFDQWMDVAAIPLTYEDLRQLVIMHVFVCSLAPKLHSYLVSHNPSSMLEAVNLANLWFFDCENHLSPQKSRPSSRKHCHPSAYTCSPNTTSDKGHRLPKSRSSGKIKKHKLQHSKSGHRSAKSSHHPQHDEGLSSSFKKLHSAARSKGNRQPIESLLISKVNSLFVTWLTLNSLVNPIKAC